MSRSVLCLPLPSSLLPFPFLPPQTRAHPVPFFLQPSPFKGRSKVLRFWLWLLTPLNSGALSVCLSVHLFACPPELTLALGWEEGLGGSLQAGNILASCPMAIRDWLLPPVSALPPPPMPSPSTFSALQPLPGTNGIFLHHPLGSKLPAGILPIVLKWSSLLKCLRVQPCPGTCLDST